MNQRDNDLGELKVAALALAATVLICLFAARACGSDQPAKPRPGKPVRQVMPYPGNPYTYMEGSVVDLDVVGDSVSLMLKPRGTFGQFTEGLLLCDYNDVAEKFFNKSGLMVLTYERTAHRMVSGVGCHRLHSVDQVQLVPKQEDREP